MNDIVERLRAVQGDNEDAREAAAAIERLQALLREAISYDSQIVHMESWWRKVRAALAGKHTA